MRDAIATHVHDGDTVLIEGFTHLICFAAGHEIIRQGRRNLTLCRLTPDLIYDLEPVRFTRSEEQSRERAPAWNWRSTRISGWWPG